ncbi:MAG: hypothetical protein DSM106950_00425 [Stigonema ocellatum SAG 48.90 = DSM 106950]|nr:hypothetical protein [Stigonema ocellatum SAG 48.90 = DSM 106950]
MTNAPENKIRVPFHPLTAELAKEWYSKGYLTTPGYLVAIKSITRPPGIEMKIDNVIAFCKKWEISKSAFYRAVDALKDEFDWEATHGIILRERSSTDEVINFPKIKSVPDVGQVSHERDAKSRKRDSQSHKRDAKSHKRDSQSHERDNEASKHAQSKGSSAPQIDSNRSDIQTLSDMPPDERESFEKFVRDEYRKSRGREIETTFAAFMKPEHFQEWYQKYQNRPEALKATQNTKWENHKERDEWLTEIESTSNPAMFAGSDKEKQAFVKWCWETKQFSWLKEEGTNGL